MSHKLKYYCRGLGTGILVTALVLMARPSSGQESLTNEEIIARAEALGMKKIDSLTDLPQPSKTDEASPDETHAADETAQSTESGTDETETTEAAETVETEASDYAINPSAGESESSSRESTSAGSSQDSSQDAGNGHTDQSVQPTASEQAPSSSIETDGSTATITISRGNGSLTVSRALAQAGLVDDAKAYDQYLCDEGYDNALRVGVYHIPLGSTYEQIARIITGKTP
jgi:hypothetical protein